MIKKFIISSLIFLFFMGCKTIANNAPATENSKETKAEAPTAKTPEVEQKPVYDDVIKYEINEDYITDDEYPARIEKEGISALVFHYTAQNFKKSLRSLTTGGNSSHWLVPTDGKTIYKIVSEDRRARHAGSSLWKSRKNVNVISIGVEVVNLGFKCNNFRKYCKKDYLTWLEFPEKQQKLIVSLAKEIQHKYNIDPLCIVGHSDIAVDRKLDPGPIFPWKKLAENGVGAWVYDNEIQQQVDNVNANIKDKISRLLIQIKLYEFGFDIKRDNGSNKYIQNKIAQYGYSFKKTPIADLVSLNQVNKYGNKNPKNKIFDEKKTDFAIQSFLMHYMPEVYLSEVSDDEYTSNDDKHDREHSPDSKNDQAAKNKAQFKFNIDNTRLFAALQALLVKYPNKARSSCGLY
ncbi:N-acetylmuramoyl-L-alanine amidase [Silvanigrella aquatica]|uniref:N-acetylmuramoyl-L-alanine amidase n=1 Tax=Silvanigrella aquatica TaxID=1915309 RepID=A0A1L4D1N0_9BACT|nr:N-acetylmuramoyl-L-alanine amidase [Silvanigrella aquatica]APJ04094.1 hypothetical protein AXG55_09310 [Silvanigrella aquatica]